MSLALIRYLAPRVLPGAFLLLAGCATIPPVDPRAVAPQWQQHQRAVNAQPDWTLTARIAAHDENDGWSGQLRWHQGADGYQVQFNAPFGQGALRLDGSPQQVEMHTSDGQVLVAADAESLLFQQLGWRLPLSHLQYWVRGLPVPVGKTDVPPVLAFDEAGRLTRLQQSRWQIEYPAYDQVGTVALPRKVYLENPELNVRLVIDRWQLGDTGRR